LDTPAQLVHNLLPQGIAAPRCAVQRQAKVKRIHGFSRIVRLSPGVTSTHVGGGAVASVTFFPKDSPTATRLPTRLKKKKKMFFSLLNSFSI
jgi:hypothetical protein